MVTFVGLGASASAAWAGGELCLTLACSRSADCNSKYPAGCYDNSCPDGCCDPALASGARVCGSDCCAPINGTCNASCIPLCAAGFANCDGEASTGCETNFKSATSCGTTCGNRKNCLTQVAHTVAAPTCVASQCTFAGGCDVGWGNCDGVQSNGCETSLLSSASSCGACGKACTAPANATPKCASGACDFTCNLGFVRCGDECKPCCNDKDCKSPPDKCHLGQCNGGSCTYVPKACVVKDCFSTPACDGVTGECKATPLTGGACGANGCFDQPGVCDNGECNGATAMDCSAGLAACEIGVCDAQSGVCAKEIAADGTACKSGDLCVDGTSCSGGVCVGTAKVCPAPPLCHSTACDPGSGDCLLEALPLGTACSTGNACVQNEACSAFGECIGTALSDGTPCVATQSCMGSAMAQCVAGACQCPPLEDGGMDMGASEPDLLPTTVDLGVVPPAAEDEGCRCGVSRGVDAGAFLPMIVVLGLLRRRRRLV